MVDIYFYLNRLSSEIEIQNAKKEKKGQVVIFLSVFFSVF
jgi:hypothetical protein